MPLPLQPVEPAFPGAVPELGPVDGWVAGPSGVAGRVVVCALAAAIDADIKAATSNV